MRWFLLVVFLAASCIGEDRSGCRTDHFLQIYADASVRDLTVYVFDENERFIESVPVVVGASEAVSLLQIKLDYPEQQRITVVVWGNLAGGKQTVTPLVAGDALADALVFLKTFQGVVLLALSPDELFWAYSEINLQRGGQAVVYHEVTLERKVSSVQIVTRGLHEFEGTTDDDFYYVIGTTYSRLSFRGVFSESNVSYRPASFFNANDDFVTPVFFTFPSDPSSVIHVDIYHADELIFTISEDNEGNPLELDENERLNVTINLLAGQLSVTLEVQPWNTVSIVQGFED